MKVIAIVNQKGGVGKTTTTINLAVGLSNLDKKVLVLDLDPQANLSAGIGVNKEKSKGNNIYQVFCGEKTLADIIINSKYKNLDIAPASIDLAGAEIELVNALSREMVLKRAIKQVVNQYDYILIDCPPSLGIITVNALSAANEVIIPVQAEYFALEGLGQLLNSVKLIKENLNNELRVGGVVITMFDIRTNLAKQVATEVKQFFKGKVFNTIIPRNIKLSEAPSFGQSIFEYDGKSAGAVAYFNLAEEVINR